MNPNIPSSEDLTISLFTLINLLLHLAIICDLLLSKDKSEELKRSNTKFIMLCAVFSSFFMFLMGQLIT